MADTKPLHETRFEAAVSVIQSLPKNELGSVLTSTPNGKAVNGKAESSDSGAESDEGPAATKEVQEDDDNNEEEETEHIEQEEKDVEQQPGHENSAESIVVNGLTRNHRGLVTEEPAPLPTKCLHEPGDKVTVPEGEPDTHSAVVNDSEADREEDCTEDMAAMQHLTSDSDSEIFCDSMEQFRQDEADHSLLLQDAMLNGDITENSAGGELKDGGEDGKQSGHGAHRKTWNEHFGSRRERSIRLQPGGEGSRSGQIGSGGDGDRWGSDRGPNGSLNEQIAVVLMRLQEDMQDVLQRLHSLEVQTASQAQSLLRESNTHSVEKKPSGWPFGISPGTLALAVVWPFVVHWLMHIFLQKRRRKQT